MPTRAAAAAAAAANMRTTRSGKVSTTHLKGKENGPPSSTTKPKEKLAPRKTARIVKAKKVEEVFCSCRGVDDGTPMVQCGPCDEWYHFRCVPLSEDDASEIMVFVCPTCQEKTGRRTVMEWEGLDALEPIDDATKVTTEEPSEAAKGADKSPKAEVESEAERQQRPSPAELSESSDDGSGDEYVEERNPHEDAGGNRHQRRTNNRRIAAVSSSDSEDTDKEKAATTGSHARRANVASTKTKTVSTSPQPTTLKRKQSISATGVATTSTTAKRKRAESSSTTASATEDAARKYCLGKFSEMFTGIFMQHPYVYPESNAKEEGAERKVTAAERKPEELTEEEKTQLRERASAFAAEVEHSVFETYAEPDKYGKPGAGVKYKERFRTLTFNLQQSDRVVLHKRISSGQVAPATLSTMSSTDLASQEQQESIKQAEQEALEHSILVKTTLPRSKITHKGLQDIEDVNEDSVVAKQRERERELEMAEQERERERERERLARLRTVQPRLHAHSNPPSASVPPESPVVPSSTSAPWDAPPPVPLTQTSDFTHAVDPELNLGDFIHIDDEPPESTLVTASSMAVVPDVPASVNESSAAGQGSGQQGQSTPMTGISPFAPNKPDMPPRASFDLNALWSAPPPPPPPNEDDTSGVGPESNDNGEAMDIDTPTPPVEEGKSGAGEPASVAEPEQGGAGGVEHEGEGGDDLDFAMFLGQEEEEKKEMKEQASRPDPQVVFEGLPHVWNGIISMPTDSNVSQELRVIARQIGGRGLASDSPLWRTLFPLDHLRIDGRVPVVSSAQYLVASRLNFTKELIAVAWTPVSDADMAALKTVSSFLINKGRHGLIFPWGSRGREWGRELYVIPLLSSHTLPEYIELLDDLHLPQTRSADCLVGIWVLNRGRLNALPPPLPPPPSLIAPPQPSAPVHPLPQSIHPGQPLPFPQPPGQQASVLPPALASALASIMPAGAPLPNAAPAALAAALSHIPAPPLSVPTANSSATAALAPVSSPTVTSPTSPAELAAKVASLTPDQIQAMLLALQQQQQPSSAPPQPPQLLPVPQQPTQVPSIHAPGPPPHLWAAQQTPTMPMQKPYGGGGHDERERERGGGPGRRGGYYGHDESPRGRGRGGSGVRRGGVNVGRDDGRGGGDFRRMSDGGWNGRGGRGAATSPSSGSPVRRDAPSYWR